MSGESASLTLAERVAIDAACDRFEEAWRAGPPPCLPDERSTVLAGLGKDLRPCLRVELLRSLALLDLDYRWRRAESAPLPGELPPRPVLEDYAKLWPELLDWPVLAFAEELRIRLTAGDRPSREEYLARLGAQRQSELESLDRAIDDVLATVFPHELRLYASGQLLFVAVLPARLEIGRQRTGDVPPVSMRVKPSGKRLVIAEPNERAFSRAHARLEIDVDGCLSIANLSKKNSIAWRQGVEDHPSRSTEILPPGAAVKVSAPLLIGLSDRMLRINRQ